MASPSGGGDPVDQLASAIIDRMGGGGGAPKKGFSGTQWVVGLAAILASVFGAWRMLETNVAKVTEKAENTAVVAKSNTEAVQAINTKISKIETSQEEVAESVKAVAASVNELKRENVDELKQQLQDARRELRRRGN